MGEARSTAARLYLEVVPGMVPGLKNRLREQREKAGLSQEAAAEAIDLSHSTIQRMENDLLPVTTDRLVAMARAYGCHPLELISDVDVIAGAPDEREAIELLRKFDEPTKGAWLHMGRTIVARG